MNRLWLFGCIAFTLMSWPTLSRAESGPRVAVVVTLAVNATPAESGRLTAALARALENTLVVDALANDDLVQVDIADDCIARPECVRALAVDLGVDQVLLLTIVRVGERFQVAITWGDGASGRTVSRVSIDIDVAQQDPQPVFMVYTRRLLPDVAERSTGAGTSAVGDTGTGHGDPGAPGDGRVTTDQSARRMTRGAWIAAGAGTVFLAAGVGFGLSARRAYNDLDRAGCQTAACSDEAIDRVASRGRVADALFGATAIAGAASAYLYWRSGGRVSSGAPEVAAFATGREVGVIVGGHF